MNQFARDFRRFLHREYIPITKGIIVLSLTVFIGHHLLALLRINLFSLFRFSTLGWWWRPWTLLTYPFVNPNLEDLFALLWLWWIGGSLERSWGGQTYGLFLGLATLITSLALALVSWLYGHIAISGLWLPLTGLTWVWAKLYPDRELLFWGLLPVKAQWLAWIHAGLTFFNFLNRYNLVFALAGISSIAVAYLFTGHGPFARGFRYWAWTHNYPGKGWAEKLKNKWRRRRLKITK